MKRSHFLAAIATFHLLLAALWVGASQSSSRKNETVAFFLIGDTHLLANKQDAGKLDERSTAFAAGLVDALNKLPSTEIPKAAGGGSVLSPRGVIHAGDCIDTGDQATNLRAQQTEWNAFAAEFGLTGKDGRLKLPIYEVHGNHDVTRASDGFSIKKIVERNKTRPGVTNVSKNGLHYSWDWADVHFVNVGITVGQNDEVKRKRRFNPLDSLEFLIADLRAKVGASGRPIIVTHHVDMVRNALPLPVDDKKAEGMEWDPADVKAFHDALKGYNVAAILYGHTHARNLFRWDGSAKPSKTGIPVFNVSKSSHYSSKMQAFFYLEINNDELTVREYQTKDGWETGSWTPQTWTMPIVRK